MNTKLHIAAVAVSVALMVPELLWSAPVFSLLSGIGCSGFAASLMALFLDSASKKRDDARLSNAREAYFSDLELQLKTVLERTLWFDGMLEDSEFDWGRDPAEYWKLSYMIEAGSRYPEEKLGYETAAARLRDMAARHSLDGRAAMGPGERERSDRMFSILAAGMPRLLSACKPLERDRVQLDAGGYLEAKEIEVLLREICMGAYLVSAPDKNRGLGIECLSRQYSVVRRATGSTDGFVIGIGHDPMDLGEL